MDNDVNIILMNISNLVLHLQSMYNVSQNYDIYENDPYCSAFGPPFCDFYNKPYKNKDIQLNDINKNNLDIKQKLLDIQTKLENIIQNKEYPQNINKV